MFQAFPPQILAFLRDLKVNNSRDWFEANRAAYQTFYKGPAEAFARRMGEALEAQLGEPVRTKIFRIHRDVRFSKDKSPYAPHLHIGFHTEASGLEPALFFGLETDRLVLGAGVFELGGARLDSWRAATAGAFGEALAEVLADLSLQGFRIGEPELKRVPAPYAADHPRAELLRRKSITAWRDMPPGAATEDAVSPSLDAFRALKPLNDWLGSLS